MTTNDPKSRILTYLGIFLVLFILVLLAVINSGLARLAEWIYPGAGLWVHLGLAFIELLGVLWLWRGTFGGHQHLLALNHPNEKEQKEFAAELARRMRNNSHIRVYMAQHPEQLSLDQASQNDPDWLDYCLFILGQKADDEIRRTAKRIFLATALSQNGRLDALIVFVSLCRLVWRISGIYNQRPHPREIIALYSAVASSTFLALSMEELDIGTEITIGFGEAFNAMAPASITASIPFAGKALQTFTSASIDGAANCYLALRAGIITRNAYMYGARSEGWPSRALVYKEAGAMLLGMSQELVGKVAGAVGAKLGSIARQAQNKSLQLGKGIIGGVGAGAEKIVSGAAGAAKNTGKAAVWPFKVLARPFKRSKKQKKPQASEDYL